MPPYFRLPLALAAGCAALVALSVPAYSVAEAQGPAALDALLARYDKAPDGAAKDALATQIDAVAHQKYASVSRLYWYTDLAEAKAAASAAKKPILHLRMLGRLDEELSCANSRLFRTTLYANKEVSGLLRDKFILYWSSERPVPKVTIDYGDGRKIERTTTGNSAHYVMDADGRVLDVLPGLYAPAAFKRELTKSLALAAKVRGKSDGIVAKAVAEFHDSLRRTALEAGNRGVMTIDGKPVIITMPTVTKSAMEIPDLKKFAPETVQMAWADSALDRRALRARELFSITNKDSVLDPASVALIAKLYDAIPDARVTTKQRDTMLTRLERAVLADSALNELDLRPLISTEIVRLGGRVDFDTLNTYVYAKVFLMPKDDAWLGLLPRTDFTGLPGDGVVTH